MDDNKKNQRVDTPLFQGDANAISGLNYSVDSHDASNFNNTTNSNNVSNSHNSTTNNYIQQSEGQRLADAKREYLEFCKHKIQGGLISSQTRRELDDLGIRLSLPKVEMYEIEQSVKEAFSTQEVLSSVDQLTLDLVVRKANNNATGIKELLPKMEVLAQKVEQEDVQYWYYLLLAIEDPGLCVKRYNDRKCDNYWQSYWTFIACLRNGLPTKANMILSELDKWDYSSDNIRLLQCAESLYGYFNRNGGEEDKGFANDLLGKSYNVSRLLTDFRNSLEYLTKCYKNRAVLSKSSLCNFYLQMFEVKASQEAKPYSAIAQPSVPATESTRTISASTQPTNISVPANGVLGKYILMAVAIIAVLFIGKNIFKDDPEPQVAKVETTVEEKPEEKTAKTQESVSKNRAKTSTAATPKASNTDKAKSSTNVSNKQSSGANSSATNSAKPTATVNSTANAAPAPKAEPSSAATQQPVQQSQPAQTTAPVEVELTAAQYLQKGLAASRGFNDAKALEYFLKAAEKGSGDANLYIGDIYYNGGNYINKNYPKAFTYYSKAAQAGNVEGQYMLGLMYRNGHGCTKNISAAKEWLAKAAARGHSKAAHLYNNL